MLHTRQFRTVTQLHHDFTEDLVFANAVNLDFYSSVDVHRCNVMLAAESFEWDFDLKELWLPKSRWSTLVRQYIDPFKLDEWLGLIADRMAYNGKKSRGMALMRTKTVQARQHGRKVSRRWGSCMLAISFRRVPTPQLTLYSRTSYMGYIAPLDLTVAYVCAQLASELTGIEVEDMQFVWMMEDCQYAFKSMAFIFNDPDYYEEMEAVKLDRLGRQAPGLFLSAKWFDVFRREDEEGKKYGDMTWGACRRIRRRWHTEVFGYEYGAQFEGGIVSDSQSKRYRPLPSVHASSLDFSALGKVCDASDLQFGDLILGHR